MKKGKKHKFSLTLLEVVIALSLTAILITFLWQTYYRMQKQLLVIEKQKSTALSKLFFEEKLSKAISLISPEGGGKLFYTKKDRSSPHPLLVFQAKLPIDPDPDFSGVVLSGLYLSERKELCLVHWVSEEKARQEVLLQNVKDYQLLFYDGLKKEWKEEWPEKTEELPAMIKCKIATKDAQEEYLFFPSQYLGPVLYPKKKPT
jgi:type II secretory pathway component PulJ